MADEKKPRGLLPFVRHMVLCEHAEPSPTNPRRANIYGVMTRAVAFGDPADFPRQFGFSVYAALTECRGDGMVRVIVSDADNHEICYVGPPYKVTLGRDPLAVHDVIIRVPQCEIPRPGIYLVEFEFEGVVLSQDSFSVITR